MNNRAILLAVCISYHKEASINYLNSTPVIGKSFDFAPSAGPEGDILGQHIHYCGHLSCLKRSLETCQHQPLLFGWRGEAWAVERGCSC
jgi:hypothetical protein